MEEFAFLYFSYAYEPLWVVRGSFCIDPDDAMFVYGPNEEIDSYEGSLEKPSGISYLFDKLEICDFIRILA